MKKMFTLICSLVLVSFVFAQHGKNFHGNKNRGNERRYSARDYDIQRRNDMIAKVNYDYDTRIYQVQRSNMRMRDKKREIRRLERERQDRIQKVYAWFSDRKNRNYPYERDGYVFH